MSKSKNDIKNAIRPKKSAAAAFTSAFPDINNNVNDHINNHVNNNNNDNVIDNIIDNMDKPKYVQVGIYFDPEVAEALKDLSKKKVQSKFVNEVVKQALSERGLLKEDF